MKKAKIWLIAMGCFLVGFGTAAAEGGKRYYLGLYGLYALENIDDQQTKDKFSGPIRVDFDDSWGVQVRGGVVLTNIISVEGQFEYISPFEASTGANKDEMKVYNLTVNGKFTCPAYETIIPYALVGLGALYANEEIVYNGRTSDDEDLGVGFRGGVGVDYRFTEELSAGVEWTYVLGAGGVSHVRYSAFSFGLKWHF